MSWRYNLLGTFKMEKAGQPSPVMHSPKGCALLSYLIVTRQSQRRESVADLLWEANSTSQSLKNLRSLLPRIRSWIPELEVDRTTLTFHPHTDSWVDLYQLDSGLELEDLERLDQALQLCKGDLLSGFYLPDAPRFNEWLLLARERLRLRVLDGYRRLCQAYADKQMWLPGIQAARRWLVQDELDESALRQLLLMLAAAGQNEAALEQFEHSRQRLWAELGEEPEPSTIELVRQLKASQKKQAKSTPSPAPVRLVENLPKPDELAAPGPLPSNAYLPFRRNNDFVGREALLQQVAACLLPRPEEIEPSTRTVAITGMGGLGKTQLAVEYAYRYGRFYPGGVYWLRFAEGDNVAAEVAAIGGERGMRLFREAEQMTLTDRTNRVQRAWQEPVPRLLIFDNCEAESLLERWQPVTGGCRVLLTSRRSQWARGLQVTTLPLSILNLTESAALLQKLVPGISREAANSISSEVGGLPLALHLAGGFLRQYPSITPANYLTQLKDTGPLHHPSLLGRGTAFSPTGHELNVANTIAINLEHLDPADEIDALARQLLSSAACFAPGEQIPRRLLLATVLGNEEEILPILMAEDALAQLGARGLLEIEGEQVVMHQLLAEYVQETLPEMQNALARVEEAVCTANDSLFEKTGVMDALAIAPVHMGHLIQSRREKITSRAADLAHHLGLYLHFIADFENSGLYLQQALSMYEEVYGADHSEIARCLNSLATLYLRAGSYHRARAVYEQALTMQEKLLGPNHILVGIALSNLGYLLALQGANRQALTLLKRARSIFEPELGADHPRNAVVLNNLGVAFMNLDSPDAARPLLERSLKIRQEQLGMDHAYTAVSLQNMGLFHLKSGQFEAARDYMERSLSIRENTLSSLHPHTARSLNALGLLYISQGQFEAAESTLERALTIQNATMQSGHPETALTFKNLADLYWEQGDDGGARTYYERALAILEETTMTENPDIAYIRNRLNGLS